VNAREDVIFLGLPARWDEDPDRAANQFRARVAKQSFSCRVARPNDAIEILRNDGVVRRLDNRRQV
jgi:hypothetical protein